MVERLADFFRYTLARSETDFISLAEEMNFIKAYLEIEKARFGNKLQIHIEIEPQVEGTKVPAMILQPLVENAIKHGLSRKVEGGTIAISATRQNRFVKLEVKDDGVGFDSAKSPRLYNGGVGVKNVRDRIIAIYGSEDALQIQSQPDKGTCVTIKIRTPN